MTAFFSTAFSSRMWIPLLLVLLVLSLLLTLSQGAVSLDWPWAQSDFERQVLWQLRWPRACMAMLLGAGLAASGCVLQTLMQNALAEPGLIGISSGSSLLAVATLVACRAMGVPLAAWGLSLAAFSGAMLMTVLLLGLLRHYRLDISRLLLLGVALGICASAATTWLLFMANDGTLREILFWMMGSLAYGQSRPLFWWLPYLLVLAWLMWRRDWLAQLQLGEQHAHLLGLDLKRVRWQLILAVAFLTGVAVALAGAIGFVGLLLPHLMRLLTRQGVALVLPTAALGGAITLLWADWLARSLPQVGELPVGMVTASFGAPLLVLMLVRRQDV